MSLLLLIRSADDVPSAVKAAGELLAYHRRRLEGDRETDDLLGIWLKHDLDEELPAWLWVDRELGASSVLGFGDTRSVPEAAAGEAGLGIPESISISGIWTLAWIDGTLFRSAQGPAERRHAILRTLAGTARSSSETGAFFPVFGAGDSVGHIEAAMSELKDRYPNLIGATWFVDDMVRGIVSAEQVRS